MARNTDRVFGIVGLGSFGGTVAKELRRFGNHVIGVDIIEARVVDYADVLSEAMIVDARDDSALREAGLGECDVAVVAMGEDLESSILAAINLRLVGAETIWAKASNRTHHRILTKVGVDRVIHPEVEVGQHVAQMLHNPLVRDYLGLGNGQYVVNLRIPESLAGQKIDDLPHAKKFDVRCIGVIRGSAFVGQDGTGCTLQADDLLLLLGNRSDLRDFAAFL